ATGQICFRGQADRQSAGHVLESLSLPARLSRRASRPGPGRALRVLQFLEICKVVGIARQGEERTLKTRTSNRCASHYLRSFVMLLSILLCASTSGADFRAGKFKIASAGQAKAEIVIQADTFEPILAFAAEELHRYVKAMSGAELPFATAASRKNAIVLAVRPLQSDQQILKDPREEDRYRLT